MNARLPESRCPECAADAVTPFKAETFTITHRGAAVDVPGLSGFRCTACGEVLFDDESAHAYAAAGDALVIRAREATAANLRRVRVKLGLTQRAAAELTGGGHNAFSRYERGIATPVAAVVNLFNLLDRHPELLRELRQES